MNTKAIYMLIKELSSTEQRKHRMSDEEVDALLSEKQEAEPPKLLAVTVTLFIMLAV